MKLNWNFQRGGGVQTKKPSVGVGRGGGMSILWNNTLWSNFKSLAVPFFFNAISKSQFWFARQKKSDADREIATCSVINVEMVPSFLSPSPLQC